MENKLCVLIDFENVAAGTEKEGLGKFDIKAVMRRLKDKGRILVARSYGDWGRFAKFKQQFLEAGITMVEMTSYRGQDKNRADIALVVDAMELAFTRPYLDTFVLLSGDSDFTPCVMRLKELDRRVIGIGTRGSTSRLLVESCDEFIFYESLRKSASEPVRIEREPPREDREGPLPGPGPEAERARALPRTEAFALLVETVEGILREDPGEVLAGLVKQSMLRKEPAFDETEYGYAGYARFLEAARDKGLVRLSKDTRSGGYRVDLPGPAGAEIEVARPVVAAEPGLPHAAGPDDGPDDGPGEDQEEAEVPRLEGRAGVLQSLLNDAGEHPLTHFIRHTVVHEFVDHVTERQAKKKRNTLMYVYGDIARRCRKTDPYVGAREVKQVINALKSAGELRHTSGQPVRSANAHFTLSKDAEELLVSLRRYYINLLLDRDAELNDSAAISELLWGDLEHRLEAEELVAWVQHERSQRVDEEPVAEDFEAEEAPRSRRSRNGRKPAGSEGTDEAEAPKAEPAKKAEAPKAEAPKAEAPKAEPAKKAEAPKAEAPKAEAPKAEAEKKPAKKPVKRSTKPKAPKAEADAEADKKPAKKPAAKNTKTAKTAKTEPAPE